MKQKNQLKLKQRLSRKLKGAKPVKKTVDEAAEAEETWQDQCVQKTFKVVREFEGGQKEHGFEGLCVHATLSEANEKRLTLFCSDAKGQVLRQSVLLEFCSEVKEPVNMFLLLFCISSICFIGFLYFLLCFYRFLVFLNMFYMFLLLKICVYKFFAFV